MKIVRDKLGDIIPPDQLRVAAPGEILPLLAEKIREELGEVVASQHADLAEFGDLAEAFKAFHEAAGFTREQVEEARIAKLTARGGFDLRLVYDPTPEQVAAVMALSEAMGRKRRRVGT